MIIDKLPKKMTAQEVFNHVKNHLLEQGEPCQGRNPLGSSNDVICLYRKTVRNKTLACAAGCLIPDSIYNKEMENKPISKVLKDYEKLLVLREHSELLTKLQSIHDKHNSTSWANQLRLLALESGLQP